MFLVGLYTEEVKKKMNARVPAALPPFKINDSQWWSRWNPIKDDFETSGRVFWPSQLASQLALKCRQPALYVFRVRWRSADLLEIFLIGIFIYFFLWVCLFISAIRSISTFATPPPTDECEKRQAEVCGLILFPFSSTTRLHASLDFVDKNCEREKWFVGLEPKLAS